MKSGSKCRKGLNYFEIAQNMRDESLLCWTKQWKRPSRDAGHDKIGAFS